MSIYYKALGDRFEDLHPKLQERYRLMGRETFYGTGLMKEIKGGPRWLYPFFRYGVKWKLLFPERGEDIPFTIRNTPILEKGGEAKIHWERVFMFGKKKRYFNALMSFDKKRNIIKDYLGEPTRLYSDLELMINEDRSLTIISNKQRIVIGKFEIPLPKFLQGIAKVREGYNEREQVYTISVDVRNPIIGTLFSYEGVFLQNELS
jgi:Domain of unknown function (DUF4166)